MCVPGCFVFNQCNEPGDGRDYFGTEENDPDSKQ